MVVRAIAGGVQRETHVTSFLPGSGHGQVFDEIAFLEDVAVGIFQPSDFFEGLVVIGYFYNDSPWLVDCHAVIGDAAHGALVKAFCLLQVYRELVVLAQVARVPFEVRLLQTASQAVYHDVCRLWRAAQRFGCRAVPCQGENQ